MVMPSNSTPNFTSPQESDSASCSDFLDAREKRLEEEHRRYIANIATSQTLHKLKSTIAGASSKTNQQTRIAEEREYRRKQDLNQNEERRRKEILAQTKHKERVSLLDAIQAKKKAKRAKYKERKQDDTLGSVDDFSTLE